MTDSIYDAKACPRCLAEWEYTSDGLTFSRLRSLYDRYEDRTVAYRCPDCGATWDRDTEELKQDQIEQ